MAPEKGGWTIRQKLIGIFVVLKVLPLVALAFIAVNASKDLADSVGESVDMISGISNEALTAVGELAVKDAITALDDRSREAIEQRTMDLANTVADFLYQRDDDLKTATRLEPDAELYHQFLKDHTRAVVLHRPWALKADGSGWEPQSGTDRQAIQKAHKNPENAVAFNYRPPDVGHSLEVRPLYLELSFIDLSGQETVKAVASVLADPSLKDLSDRSQTWWKAERFFEELKDLQPGDIFVSEVIGPYVGAQVIGTYTPEKAAKAGIRFDPASSGYAGKENPLGKRFQGIVRYAMPYSKDGEIIGYVSLVLDHTHIMQFTDHVSPTDERFSEISDPGSGNYAFMWDNLGRSISHPRDYFISGVDPETGERVVPWLEKSLYDNWQASGLSFDAWQHVTPTYVDQSLEKKPALESVRNGTIALDCRFLNFAPQCEGWRTLTEDGGSGSFLIFWSNLWKLTTAAAIPYHTGQYGESKQGFGFVTIGANVDEFHKAALQTGSQIDNIFVSYDERLLSAKRDSVRQIAEGIEATVRDLTVSTVLMIIVVVAIAVLLASLLTNRIQSIVSAIRRFQDGRRDERLAVESKDELGQLSQAYNQMANSVQEVLQSYEVAKVQAEDSNRAKSEFLATMSHELRTPLNAVLGYAELLQVTRKESLSEKDRSYLDNIVVGGKHLLDLINDLLDLARIEAREDQIEVEPVDVAAEIATALDMAGRLENPLNVQIINHIQQDAGIFVSANGRRLRQVLLNLLSNGIKFNKPGGTVTIEGRRVADGRYKILVSDTGCGIPYESQSKIFTMFERLRSDALTTQEGTGIGLTVCKILIEQMNGQIAVESTVDEGSTFWIALPLEGQGDGSKDTADIIDLPIRHAAS